MAQTKTSQRKSKSKSKSKARAPSRSKAARTSRPKASASGKAKSAGSATRPKKSASRPAPSKPQAVLETVEETAKDAGGKVAGAVSRAKVPLLAGSAALAAGAGGLALGARQGQHRSGRVHVSSKDLAKAARKVGDVGAQVGEVALEVRRAREVTNGNGNGGAHRSPIEVVLQSLTQRRPRG